MDKSQTRTLIVLAALVTLAGGLLYWQGEAPVDMDPDATVEVWTVAEDDVRRVAVTRGDQKLVLERTDAEAEWSVVEPYASVADQRRTEDLVRSLASIRKGIPVDAPADRAGEFGLGDPPDARVELTVADGSTRTLDVGTTAAVGYRTYVRGKGTGIVAATGDPTRLLTADAERFRDTRVLRFEPAEVRAVSVVSEGGTLEAEGQGRRWTLTGYERADANAVDDWISGLLDLRFDHLGEPQPVAAPRFVVRVGLADGSVVGFDVGEDTDMGLTVTGTDGRGGVVFNDGLKLLGMGPTDVGQKTAFLVEPEETDAVTVASDHPLFAARRDGSAWVADGAEPHDVAERVRRLAAVPVEVRLHQPPPPIDTVELTVTVKDPDQPEVVWELGPVQPDETRTLHERGGPGAGLRVRDSALRAALDGLP